LPAEGAVCQHIEKLKPETLKALADNHLPESGGGGVGELSTGNAGLAWLRERTTIVDLSPAGSGLYGGGDKRLSGPGYNQGYPDND
jgi:hypothetical protein